MIFDSKGQKCHHERIEPLLILMPLLIETSYEKMVWCIYNDNAEGRDIMKADLFKQAMANYPTGVTVVTALDEQNNPVGLTVNSFASVSLDPLLILWSIDKRVSTYETFTKIDKFAVNILAGDQVDVASLFASRTSNQERFANCIWKESEHNLPIIENSTAILQCKKFNQIEAGDHMILIGEIIEIDVETKSPLLYHGRKLGAFPESFHED